MRKLKFAIVALAGMLGLNDSFYAKGGRKPMIYAANLGRIGDNPVYFLSKGLSATVTERTYECNSDTDTTICTITLTQNAIVRSDAIGRNYVFPNEGVILDWGTIVTIP